MSRPVSRAMRDETLAIHGGYTPDSTRSVAVPVYQTVAHDFRDADHAGAIMDLEAPGFHYNRINNPTVDVLEQRLTALEGGVGAMAVSSGAAAVSMSVLNLLGAGDNLVAVPHLYGATYTYFAHVLPRFGIEVRFSVDDHPDSIAARIDERTKAVFCETVGNPAGNVIDLAAVAEAAHARGVPVIADNTVATPLLLKPFRHGADVVIHSLTKFVGGHGTTLGGIIIDGGAFPWVDYPERFGCLIEPEPAFHAVQYTGEFSHAPYITRCRTVGLRNTGAALSPFNAFLLLLGLETLAVRLPRHEANARAVAAFLSSHRHVTSVSFLGLPDNPYHELACRYLGNRVPSIMTFTVRGGREAGIAVFN
ncbi:MAG: aminotransferase class V-fold PLP-dependent enzyme, partial [Solirubrobacterales bacterium]|nr:aminotransferase class V-fold PLP-dependent enzyme [Solirubrobacterales bacterium]